MNRTIMLIALFKKAPSAAALVILMILAAGCASKPVDSVAPAVGIPAGKNTNFGSEPAISALSLIARDFAHILPQVPELRPDQVTLSVLPDADGNSDFAESLSQALFQEGYAVRIGEGNYSSVMLTYQIRESGQAESGTLEEASGQPVKIYQLSVGDISLRRRYSQQDDGQILPVSAMEGRGLDPTAMVVDDSIFRNRPDNLIAANIPDTRRNATSVDVQPIVPQVQAPAIAADASKIAEGAAATANTADESWSVAGRSETLSDESAEGVEQMLDTVGNADLTAANTAAVRIAPLALNDTVNFRDLEQSNYVEFFREAVVLDTGVIDFPNNSSILLPNALSKLKMMVSNIERPDDLISVIGTSHGKAPYPGAQQVLAKERAIAIRNSLLAMGVELDRIYLEASWSENYYDEVLPRRAAVVEVKRLAPLNVSN